MEAQVKAKKKTKTFNIGEYCQGGVLTVEIVGKVVTIIGKEWDFKAGSTKNSDQSNAKEFTRGTQVANEPNAYTKVYDFLTELTTHYYAEEVIKYIESIVPLNRF